MAQAARTNPTSHTKVGGKPGGHADNGAQQISMAGLSDTLGYSLRQAQLYAFQEFGRAMASFDVRPSQYALLTLLHNNPGLKPTLAARILAVQKANFVGLLDGIEARGLAERRKEGPDRRAYALHLTPQGKALAKKLQKQHRQLEDRLRQKIGAEDSATLLELLNKLRT